MTSSFGTVIGTPRDKLPSMGDTNYDRTAPDLTEAVNKQIDRNILDTKQFFADMMKIEEQRIKNRDANLQNLVGLTKSAIKIKQYFDATAEVRRDRKDDKATRERVEEARAQRELDDETTIATGKLASENTVEANDMAVLLNQPDTNEEIIEKLFSSPTYGAINEYINKNDWLNTGLSAEAEEKWDAAEELWLVALYDKYSEAGGDTRSGKWKRYIKNVVQPEIRTRKEKAFREWETSQNAKVRAAQSQKVDMRIANGLRDGDVNGTELVQYVKAAKQYSTDQEALEYIVDYMYAELTNKTERVTPAMVDDFMNEVKFKHSGTGKETTLIDSNFGKNGALTTSLIARLNRAKRNALEDPKDLLADRMQEFETNVVTPYRDEEGNISDQDQLIIASKWRKEFPSEPFSQSILSAGVGSHTGNKYGTSYGKYSVPGQADVLADYKTDLQDVVIKKYKLEDDISYSRSQLPGSDNRAIEKAYADLKRRVEESEIGNQGMDFGTRVASELEIVKKKLADGEYAVVVPEYSTGTAQDVIDTTNYFLKPGNITSSNFASPLEKVNLETSRVALNDGNLTSAITPFWKNIAKKLGVTPEKLLMDRLIATGGLDPKSGDIINSNEIYKLSKEDLDDLLRNPNAHSSVDVFYKVNEETGEKNSTIMLNAARLKKSDGSGFINDGYYTLRGQGTKKLPRVNSDLTASDLLTIRADDIGRYGISTSEMKEAFSYTGNGKKPILEGLLNKTFDEDSQSQVMALLWHIKLQKMNSIRGVEIDGDFSWRLSGLTDVEQAALEEFMPALKDAPYFSRPNTLQEDVMAAIVNEIKPTPVEQPKSKKRSRR